MRLQTALMPQGEETDALEQDISELEKMIDGYLAFARGEGEEKSALVSLDQMLGQMISQYDKLQSGPPGLAAPGRGSPEAGGAAQAMRRALDNLIGNALRYSRYAEVRLKHDDNLYIFIDDDGPGIEPEQRADALRPFVRLEQSRNKETGGTGLGLAIAHDIILSHGGELSLIPRPRRVAGGCVLPV